MQTLGLSDSTTRSEGRLKSLFWPSIKNGADVDYLGAQGYWVCTLIAIVSLYFLCGHGYAGCGSGCFPVLLPERSGSPRAQPVCRGRCGIRLRFGYVGLRTKCAKGVFRGVVALKSPSDVDCLELEARF